MSNRNKTPPNRSYMGIKQRTPLGLPWYGVFMGLVEEGGRGQGEDTRNQIRRSGFGAFV